MSKGRGRCTEPMKSIRQIRTGATWCSITSISTATMDREWGRAIRLAGRAWSRNFYSRAENNMHLKAEWLETNGLGGFASSTVAGINTRRYHGLLTAATMPPVGRVVLLSKMEET